MKIIFMGTPDFAVPALEKIINSKEFEIVAVYTKAPKIAGRGQKITNSAIHEIALKHGLRVITPTSLKDKNIQEEFKSFNADAALIVAYGLILPKIILESTKFGCINIHPSILPRWRGATPIQSTLFAGDKKIGVSIIKMSEGIDDGDLILQDSFDIAENDNYKNLAPKLSEIGAQMACKSLILLRDGKANFVKQDESKATFSKKILKSDAKIDFEKNAFEINNQIRALSGFMTAFFEFRGEKIKIFSAKIIDEKEIGENYNKFKNGEIIDKNFTIKCAKDAIRPLILQREGKRIMTIEEFLLGFKF